MLGCSPLLSKLAMRLLQLLQSTSGATSTTTITSTCLRCPSLLVASAATARVLEAAVEEAVSVEEAVVEEEEEEALSQAARLLTWGLQAVISCLLGLQSHRTPSSGSRSSSSGTVVRL